jgi:hypothetical protein
LGALRGALAGRLLEREDLVLGVVLLDAFK